MKKNIIIALVAISTLICITGFKDNTNLNYKVISVNGTGANNIEEAINKNSIDGWELDSTMVIPEESTTIGPTCHLIFKKNK